MKLFTTVPLLVALTGTACTTPPTVVTPASLAPAANETLLMTVPARGVQIYECRVTEDGPAQWALVAPDAELFDVRSRSIGRHGAGPAWEANDGSRVVGTLKARAEAPAAGAIPWLLLSAKSAGAAGVLSGVTSIQRVNTQGGLAPATPCTAGLNRTVVRVPYTADYRFFTLR